MNVSSSVFVQSHNTPWKLALIKQVLVLNDGWGRVLHEVRKGAKSATYNLNITNNANSSIFRARNVDAITVTLH